MKITIVKSFDCLRSALQGLGEILPRQMETGFDRPLDDVTELNQDYLIIQKNIDKLYGSSDRLYTRVGSQESVLVDNFGVRVTYTDCSRKYSISIEQPWGKSRKNLVRVHFLTTKQSDEACCFAGLAVYFNWEVYYGSKHVDLVERQHLLKIGQTEVEKRHNTFAQAEEDWQKTQKIIAKRVIQEMETAELASPTTPEN